MEIFKNKAFGLQIQETTSLSIYILDFYCYSRKLVIEVDGSIHDLAAVNENDKQREEFLQKDGLTILDLTTNRWLKIWKK